MLQFLGDIKKNWVKKNFLHQLRARRTLRRTVKQCKYPGSDCFFRILWTVKTQ